MSSFINASIGKKFLVSISGLFLISFLAVHLFVNLFLLGGPEAYNLVAHFMSTDRVISIMEPLLGIGFLLHIIYSVYLTITNQSTRPQKYKVVDQSESSTWSSQNMFVLGGLILVFLVIHLSNFWFQMQFGEMDYIEYGGIMVHDAYSLVTAKFTIWWQVLLYVIAAIFLGLHLLHGFQSAFLTLGLYNKTWRQRLVVIGVIYTIIITAGFSVIPLYFLIGYFTA
jgi:succinate dehydrogenase / fumarate reductase, cytochrome b subunit